MRHSLFEPQPYVTFSVWDESRQGDGEGCQRLCASAELAGRPGLVLSDRGFTGRLDTTRASEKWNTGLTGNTV